MAEIYTISELNRIVSNTLEQNPSLRQFYAKGEVSNLRFQKENAYFTLKDEFSVINAVCFSSTLLTYKNVKLQDGLKLIIQASISVYPPQGRYQVIIEKFKLDGEGDLNAKFNALKEKLKKEGLFDINKKKKLPSFPKKIALLTSTSGVVIRDVVVNIHKKYPCVEILVFSSLVQGELAISSILEQLYKINEREDIDLVILARGGGSLEDLWCFNDEFVARAIFAMKKPTISAIGHETDFTIADFVSDMRASTPTEAANLAVPNLEVELNKLSDYQAIIFKQTESKLHFQLQLVDQFDFQLKSALKENLQNKKFELNNLHLSLKESLNSSIQIQKEELSQLSNNLISNIKLKKSESENELNSLMSLIINQLDKNQDFEKHQLEHFQLILINSIQSLITTETNNLNSLEKELQALDFNQILQRGFSLTYKDGVLIKKIDDVKAGDKITTLLQDGEIESEVK